MVWDRLLVHWWARLGVAVVLVAIGAGLRATLFVGLGENVRFAPFYLVVILAALLGGLAAGLLATALSVLVTALWLHAGAMTSTGWWSVAAFAIICTIVSVITEHMRRASERLEREKVRAQSAEVRASFLNAELERRVARRTRELEEANAELESFTYSVSHDLLAPLRAIDGFSASVMEDADERLANEDIEQLKRVRTAARHMTALVEGLLTLSRVARREIVRSQVDLTLIAESAIETLHEVEPERRVETVVAPDMHACADEDLARVVLANLLGNAWKFTSKHAEARVECGTVDRADSEVFFVRDDGVGFDQQHAEHLFRPFERLHSGEENDGEGIGLATVSRVVRRHGGRIWAESKVGKGTTFFFTLPDPEEGRFAPVLPGESRSAVTQGC